MSINAGINLEIIEEDANYVLFKYTFSRFGDNGGVLLTEYNKHTGTSEDGFHMYAYQAYTQKTDKRNPRPDLDQFNKKMWQLSEVDTSGNVIPWYRTFSESIQSSFPIPYARTLSQAFIEIRFDGDTSGITSDITLHLMDND